MSEIKLSLNARTLTGKKLAGLRKDGIIPSVIYGEGEPVLAQSAYNETEKALRTAGYHSTIDVEIEGKKKMVIVKDVNLDPVSRRILNVEFQAVSANSAVEATAPIKIENFEKSEANKAHLALLQVMEEIEVKAKPGDLPEEIVLDASKMATVEDKLVVADIVLPKGVELADKELDKNAAIAILSAPAAAESEDEAATEEKAE
jgi:large subunit ribosomal protein L25